MAAILSKNTAKKVKRAAEAATTTIAKSPSKTMRVAKRQMRAKATATIPHKVEKTRKDSRFELSRPTAAVAKIMREIDLAEAASAAEKIATAPVAKVAAKSPTVIKDKPSFFQTLLEEVIANPMEAAATAQAAAANNYAGYYY